MAEATFLERIVVATRARLAERQAIRSIEDLRAEAERMPPALDFAAAITPTDGGIRAIAEIKRASPSKGVLHAHLDPAAFAERYVAGGAAAISVLTEQDFFQGSLDDLRTVKATAAGSSVPVLRKDFTTDAYQVIEARAAGADTFLLIVAMLDDDTLRSLLAIGRELGMEALVEAHTAEEAQRAVTIGARIIGINARDLRTFEVDTTLLRKIRASIPADRLVIAESGIANRNDVIRMRAYGAQAILVGESLVREGSMIAPNDLTHLPRALRLVKPRLGTMIKLCGMQSPEDALAAHAAGADLIGMVFVEGKRRRVSIATARAIVAALPEDVVTVALFADESDEVIRETAHEAGVTLTQSARAHASDIIAISTLEENHQQPDVATIGLEGLALLDSAAHGVWGGTGETGDWSVAARWAAEFPILLAGGLTSENVGDAIRQVRPWGVDVSSGIEGADGRKDPARMRAFVEAVRATDR